MKFFLEHWKDILLAGLALVVFWAFMPSGWTRKGQEAEARAEAAIAEANDKGRIADEAKEKAAKLETEKASISLDRAQLAKDKIALTNQVARLVKGLPPRPVVGPGNGVPGSTSLVADGGVGNLDECRALVSQLYDVVDAQTALIAKHEEDDAKEKEFNALQERILAEYKTALTARTEESEALRRALVEKDLQIKAMKHARVKERIRDVSGTAGVVWLIRKLGLHM